MPPRSKNNGSVIYASVIPNLLTNLQLSPYWLIDCFNCSFVSIAITPFTRILYTKTNLISTIIYYRFESRKKQTFDTRKLMVRVRGQSHLVFKSKCFINE